MITLLLILFTDSIQVKITRVRTEATVTKYWMKADNGVKYYTECSCAVVKRKGETVTIAKPY